MTRVHRKFKKWLLSGAIYLKLSHSIPHFSHVAVLVTLLVLVISSTMRVYICKLKWEDAPSPQVLKDESFKWRCYISINVHRAFQKKNVCLHQREHDPPPCAETSYRKHSNRFLRTRDKIELQVDFEERLEL